MRYAIVGLALASIILATASVGYGQSDQQQPQPKAVTAHPNSPEECLWPTPEQEEQIRYRPCSANVMLPGGRPACLG